MVGLALVLVLLLPPAGAQTAARGKESAPYVASGTCGPLPRVLLATPPGFCVGLVAWGLRFPRGLQPLPGGDLLVAEMGGFAERRGRLTRLRSDGSRSVLFSRLDRPHAVVLGPDRKVYVGTVGGVFRFDPDSPALAREDVIGGASGVDPLPSSGRHPLVNFVFDAQGDLYVGIGSASDNCEGAEGELPSGAVCAESEGPQARGVVRRYVMDWPQGRVRSWSVHAAGLRNSMALAVHAPSGALLQGENSRDAIHVRDPNLSDEALPHDELNLLVEGGHYGWPYCYDENRPSPEFPHADCGGYRKPALLLPPHAAPLGMTYYLASAFPPEWQGALIVPFHGYRKAGHRVVAYRTDANGLPADPARELIGGWEQGPRQPMGAPVDVKVGADGALYLTEDRNGTLLKLDYMGHAPESGK